MDNCIFCEIAKGNIPSFKVFEDNDFVSILDINPNLEGVTLVLPKKHYDSYLFEQNDKLINSLISVSKKVAKKIEKGLSVNRVALVFEGMGINHLHAKLYPLHGVGNDFLPMAHGTYNVYFKKYPGYITTQLGEKADFKELEQIAEKIKNCD